MSDYTPDTQEVRRDYATMRNEFMFPPTFEKAKAFRESGNGEGEFDRWFAEERRKAKVEALEAFKNPSVNERGYDHIGTVAARPETGVAAALADLDDAITEAKINQKTQVTIGIDLATALLDLIK